nr:butyrophilin subfamily 1 member A1-like [Chelonoidis abingdonii]
MRHCRITTSSFISSVGLGSAPVISVEGHQDGGIRVIYRSTGWYPKPEVLWRDLQGQNLPSASKKISQEANGLFQTVVATVITEESNQKVSCCVRNPRLKQERESVISIAELFFPRVNPWMVALGVILGLLAVLIGLASYCFWRQHRTKETLRSELESEKDKLQAELRWRRAQIYAGTVHTTGVLSMVRPTSPGSSLQLSLHRAFSYDIQ